VRVKLGEIDEIALDVNGTVLERLDAEGRCRRRKTTAARTRRSRRPDRHCRRPDDSEAAPGTTHLHELRRRPEKCAPWRSFENEPQDLSTLQIALGVSVIAHAALLTVRFVDPESFNRVFQDTPLEVILVNARPTRTARQGAG
jgi:hypothetical protein